MQHALGLGVLCGHAGCVSLFLGLSCTGRFFLGVRAFFVCLGYLGLEAAHHNAQALCQTANFVAQIDGQNSTQVAASHARSKALQLTQRAHNNFFKRKQTDAHQCDNR